ncbi:hypothetical protein NUW58_g8207 [Xylaria curta]|uniref:Uncharacterized protein n=1 Tax=Xylaria curta TaxID=42375 RepID=A0ACC1N9J7_9PEZI|nr:hypothetical protein NUW58_g8207 [Xylaria curta]
MPFQSAKAMAGDPSFAECTTEACKSSWGLRIVNSVDIVVHSAGLYSFFQDYYQDCVDTEDCQERVLEVTGSSGVVIYNLFTVAISSVANGINKSAIKQKDTQRGFTTEVSVWIPLPGQDNIDIIYVGTEIWETPTVSGSAPVIIVLPTSSLKSTTTISPGDYTTSFEYGHIGSTTNTFGQVMTAFVTTITTITIHIPTIVTDGIPYSNVNVTGSRTDGGFIASPSVSIPLIGVPLPDGNGGTTTRTMQLPPWPAVTNGPPRDGGSSDPFDTMPSSTGTGTYYTPFPTTVSATGATVMTIKLPTTVGETTVSCPPQSQVTFAHTTLHLVCPTPTAYSFHFDCPSSKVVTFLTASTAVITQDRSLVTLFPIATQPTRGSSSTISTTTTTTPLPGSPAAIIRWPTPLATIGPLPPWPEITIKPNHDIEYDDEPDDECKTQTASVCSTTLHITATVTQGTTTSTTSTSTGDCEKVEGCSATNSQTVTRTSTTVSCEPTPSGNSLNVCDNDALVYPQDPANVGAILSLLSDYKGKYEQVGAAGETAFIWVPALDQETFDSLRISPFVYDVQYYEQYNKDSPNHDVDQDLVTLPDSPDDPDLKRAKRNESMSFLDTVLDQIFDEFNDLAQRAAAPVARSRFWQRSVNSRANAAGYDADRGEGYNVYIINEDWVYMQHPEFTGQGTVELISPGYTFNDPAPAPVGDSLHGSGVAAQINGAQLGTCKRCHVVWFQTNRWKGYPDYVIPSSFIVNLWAAYADIVSKGLKGKAVINMSFSSNVDRITPAGLRSFKYILDKLENEQQAVLVAAAGNRPRKDENGNPLPLRQKEIDRYPAKFGSPNPGANPYGQLKNMIIVGATNPKGEDADSVGQTSDYITTFAPGQQVWAPTNPSGANPWEMMAGTSFAAPAVAGIVAYLRSLDSPFKNQLEDPARVKQMITFLAHRHSRQKIDNSGLEAVDALALRPIAWNGQVQNVVNDIMESHSCLADYDTIDEWDVNGACRGIDIDMSKMGNGESTGSCSSNGGTRKRDEDSCPVLPGGSGGQRHFH